MNNLQQCGHPHDVIVGTDEGTYYCRMCQMEGEIESLKQRLAEEQARFAMLMEDVRPLAEWLDKIL